MRHPFILASMLLGLAAPATAQFSIGIGLPSLSIGINVPVFPRLVRVPGYPVYYAPGLQSNFFFYDGMYWVYEGDEWYASTWYNGPWALVSQDVVPLYMLRVPVRYYRSPPPYFRGWRTDAPPRWGEHWGPAWQQHRNGWDQWNRNASPAPAPLPSYQQQYTANRYPNIQQQPALRGQNYRFQPREPVVRQHFQEQAPVRAPAPPQRTQPAPMPARPVPQVQDPVRAPPIARAPAVQEPRRQAQPQAAPAPREPTQQPQRQQPPQRQEQAPQRQQQPPQRQEQAPQRQQQPPQRQEQAQQPQQQQQQQQPPQRQQQQPAARQKEPRPEKAVPQEPQRSQSQGKDREDGDGGGQDRRR